MTRLPETIKLPKELEPLDWRLQEYGKGEFGYLYFLVRDDRVVYVGQTLSLHRRIDSHRKSKKAFDRVLFCELDQSTLQQLESALICHLSPEYNAKERSANSSKLGVLRRFGFVGAI